MGSEAKKVFAVMAKPVGSICNMRCSYCYYLGTDSLSLTPELRVMPDELLDKFVREYIEDSAGPVVSFTWHGGEPTLAGIDFFRRAVQLQKKYLPAGSPPVHSNILYTADNLQKQCSRLDGSPEKRRLYRVLSFSCL